MYKLTGLITMLLLLQACSSLSSAFRASPAPDSGFIDTPDQMTEWRERSPLDRVWIYDREDFHKLRERFTKIYFAPATTNFLLKSGWQNSLNQVDKEGYRKDVSEMATYIRQAFERAFKDDPKHRFTVVQEPDHETTIYEFALVEIVATKAHLNALGIVVPDGGLVSAAGKGSIAIEAKASNGATNDVLMTWADRERDQRSLFSLSDYSWYSHARKPVDTWAEQLVRLYNTPITEKVEDRLPFTLNPF